MKTILPICIAVVFFFAPGFHLIQSLLPKSNAPEISFHTPKYTQGKILPRQITENVTIGPEDGIILINTTVTVNQNATLTVKPGTIVALAEYAGIRVLGNLHAKGTTERQIQFISNELNHTNRTWTGIFFEQSGTGQLEHTLFQYASPAISCTAPNKVILKENEFFFGNIDLFGPC